MKPFYLLLFIAAVVFYGCKPFHYREKDIEGVYKRVNYDGSKYPAYDLTFYNGGFILVDRYDWSKSESKPFSCCDTAAYGEWKIDNEHGVLVLSTAYKSEGYLHSDVREEAGLSTDSVYFLIANSMQLRWGKYAGITYYVSFSSRPEKLGDYFDTIEFKTNRIALPNPGHALIKSFTIFVYPTHDYINSVTHIAVSAASTSYYEVKMRNANIFKIDIPKLSDKFFTYLRLNDHLIKIVNRHEVIWDGIRYIKKQ